MDNLCNTAGSVAAGVSYQLYSRGIHPSPAGNSHYHSGRQSSSRQEGVVGGG